MNENENLYKKVMHTYAYEGENEIIKLLHADI